MEYASPIWNGADTTSSKLLERLQKKALRRLKIDEPLTFGIVPLNHWRNVASLCVFYRHIFLQPSIELADILPSEASSTRANRSSVSGHPYCVRIPRSKTELHLNLCIPRTSRLWNSLPASTNMTAFALPASPNMTAFETGVKGLLMDQMFEIISILIRSNETVFIFWC